MTTQRVLMNAMRIGFLVSLVAAMGCTGSKKGPPENTLHLYAIEKIKGLDPISASDQYSGVEVSRTYEGLMSFHYLKRPYVLEPNLAESLAVVSKDGKDIKIKIRKGVLFQDDACFEKTAGKGREVTAEDFIYSWKRLADPKNLSEGWWIFDGKIVGLNEWREEATKSGKADYSKPIEGLKAIDPYTLEIKLKQRSAQFLYTLAMPFASVVAHEAVEKYGPDFSRNPVGTGPFKLVRGESNLNSKLVWVKNPNYREVLYPSEGMPEDREAGRLADAGKRLPFADKIVVPIFVESQPQWLNFLDGKLDASGIPKDNYAQTITPGKELSEDFKNKGIVLIKDASLDVTHISFNMEDPILGKNKFLRQAMSLAYNNEPVIELFYNNRALPAQGPIPPGLAGYRKDFKNPYRQFNLAKAKELLKKAGYPDGKGLPEFEYTEPASTTARQMSEFFVKAMAEIGIKIKVNAYSWPEFMKAINNKKMQLWGYAWSADYPDAENFLQMFYSKNVSPGPNDANYRNPEFDRLYEKALTLPDSPARTKIYESMVDLVVEDCPWIFGVHRITFALVQPWLKNYKIHEFEHGRAKYLRVDLDEYGKRLK